ncbi:Armadillo-type fold [Phytophthora cactorum]|nr:Armadillo-type fold [Phytophthora cactorum]
MCMIEAEIGNPPFAFLDDDGSLLKLVRECLNDDHRTLLYEADGIQILSNVLSVSEFNALRNCVEAVPKSDVVSLLNALQKGTDYEKEQALIRCKLWVQVAQALVVLVKDRDLKHNFWAAEALGNLAADNEAIRSKIARKESITALVTLIQVGNDEHKHRAAYALGEIALSKAASEMIVQNGAIPSLVGLVRVGTEQQKKTAMSLLGILLRTSYTNRAEIEREKSVAPLIALTLLGSDDQKSSAAIALQRFSSNTTIIVRKLYALEAWRHLSRLLKQGPMPKRLARLLLQLGIVEQKVTAASVLKILAQDEAGRVEICREGAIGPLVGVIRDGPDELKCVATDILALLAGSDALCSDIAREGGVAIVIKLLREDFIKSGTHKQKTNAADALRSLAKSDVIRAEICHYRGAERMLKLLKTGLDEQKAAAAGALESFAWNEEMNSSIVCEGGIPPLVQLLRSGNQVQKTNAAGALASILRHNGNAPGFFESGDQGAISSLIALLETGTDEQKNSAAVAVGCLTTTWDNCADIERRGGVDLLIALSKTGTQEQKRSALNALDGTDEEKEMAAQGLEIMARTSSFTAITIVKQGGVASLVKLLRDGTDRQKEIATAAIASLGSEDSNVTEIVRQGGVDLIVGLLQVGADVQREEASLALQNVVRIGNTSRDEIVHKESSPH